MQGAPATVNEPSLVRLGFVGTGAITSAIVRGLCAPPALACRISLSPRNASVAARLAAQFSDEVAVAASNQDVLDRSDVVFIAVRPQVADEVLRSLKFRPDHRVISLVAAMSKDDVTRRVRPAASVVCAVPLPTVAARIGPTAIFPADPVAEALFDRLGLALPIANEDQFQALWASTAVIATFFESLDSICSWLVDHAVPAARARDYVAMMFHGLVDAAQQTGVPFAELSDEFATKGGLNEQYLAQLRKAGVFDACPMALDAILARIRRGAANAG
jgi:pyrroline-5-carboxylate reductase